MQMTILVWLSCLLWSSFSSGVPVENFLRAITVKNCGTSILPPSSPDRIVGGDKAKHGQYPWMVSLHEYAKGGFEHICGGSVLNERWIITAAHCIPSHYIPRPTMYRAYVGLHKQSELSAAAVQRIKISEIILHEDYDDDTFENDIALLKTSTPIDIAGSKGYVNGICLPKSKKDPTGYAKVTGWGHQVENGVNTDTLMEVVVPMVDREKCNEAYDDDPDDDFDPVFDTMICAGRKGKDSCQSDSGGPLIQTDSNGVSTLIGIVSHGEGCGEKYFPGVYTKVSPFRSWIANITSK